MDYSSGIHSFDSHRSKDYKKESLKRSKFVKPERIINKAQSTPIEPIFQRKKTFQQFKERMRSPTFAKQFIKKIESNYKVTDDKQKQENIILYKQKLERLKNEEYISSNKRAKIWIFIMIMYAIIQCIINIFACVLFTLDGYMDSDVITA